VVLYRFFRLWLILIFKMFFLMKEKGGSYLPAKGGYIIASNHLSFLDPIVLGVACPKPLNFMARQSLFKIKFLGGLISRVGAFPVRRQGADAAGMKRAIRRLRHGRAVVVFPEGTRSPDGRLGSGRIGIAVLAAKAKVKVIPAFIRGTNKAMPKGRGFIRPCPISVSFGQPLDPADILPDNPGRQDYQRLTDLIMDRLRKLGA